MAHINTNIFTTKGQLTREMAASVIDAVIENTRASRDTPNCGTIQSSRNLYILSTPKASDSVADWAKRCAVVTNIGSANT